MATEISPARLPVHHSELPPRNQWPDCDDSCQRAVSDDLERRLAALNEDSAFMFESWPVPDNRVEAVLNLSMLLNAESAPAELLHWVDLWRERVRAAVLHEPETAVPDDSEDESDERTNEPETGSCLERPIDRLGSRIADLFGDVSLPYLHQGWPCGESSLVFTLADECVDGLEVNFDLTMRIDPTKDVRAQLMARLNKAVADFDARLAATDLTLS